MTDSTVGDILPRAPFTDAGKLQLETGKYEFEELSIHTKVKEEVKIKSRNTPQIWSLAGPYGIGRTWTMAWLGRKARNNELDSDSEWTSILIPGPKDGIRNFYESIFRNSSFLRRQMRDDLDLKDQFTSQSTRSDKEKLLDASLSNEEIWAVLRGDRGRFPKVQGVNSKPKWTNQRTQKDFLSLWLSKMKDAGIDNLLILVDEFEELATVLGKKKLNELSNGLRGLYDELSGNEDVPNTQIILSMTSEIATKLSLKKGSPSLKGWVQALQERMGTEFIMGKLDLQDAKDIAAHVIEYKRTESAETPYYPYEESTIEIAYEASDKTPRDLAQILNKMYVIGFEQTTISKEVAEEALRSLNLNT